MDRHSHTGYRSPNAPAARRRNTAGCRRTSAAWISDHIAPSEPKLLPCVYFDHVQDTGARIVAQGREIVTNPFPEGLITVATFRDPGGNVIGLWHDTTR